jgi:hypothetical protein
MDSLTGLKTCRKGLHQYSSDRRTCPDCQRNSRRLWRKRNPERDKELTLRWKQQNPERNHEHGRRCYKKNPELKKENSRRWYQQNTERHKENGRHWREQNPERNKKLKRSWNKQNHEKVNAINAKRRAAKKQAVAPWADFEAIKQIYAEAVELTKSTGIPHEVDHIYPLQSDYMCGLHVETNLQILTKSENASKSNRTWPGQLDCQKD